MAAIFFERGLGEDAQAGQEPDQERHFKHNSHHEDQHRKGVHVRIQGDLVDNAVTNGVLGEKAQREGENNRITEGAAEKEHDRPENEGEGDVFLLARIEGRGDEAPDFVHQVRECDDQRQGGCAGNVRHKLRRNVDADDLDLEIGRGKPLGGPVAAHQFTKPSVEEEIPAGGAQDKVIEDVREGNEHADQNDEKHDARAEDTPTEHLQVIPEGHLFIGRLRHGLRVLLGLVFFLGFLGLDFFLDLVHSLLEALDALAEALHELGNLGTAEQQQNHQRDDQDLGPAEGLEQ